jgi:hypothetical protein
MFKSFAPWHYRRSRRSSNKNGGAEAEVVFTFYEMLADLTLYVP